VVRWSPPFVHVHGGDHRATMLQTRRRSHLQGTYMPTFIRTIFSTLVLAALCTPIAFAQNDPGSISDLLEADFAPLHQTTQSNTELNSPLILGPELQANGNLPAKPELVPIPPPPSSVLEVPSADNEKRPTGELASASASEEIILPELTMPTPENTTADLQEGLTVLRPRFDDRQQAPVDLLPFNGRDDRQLPKPRMQAPQALNYGSQTSATPSRLQVPIQFEFYSVNRSFGYSPLSGLGVGGFNAGFNRPAVYQPFGGYVPYGGYGRGYGGGRYCPSGR